MRTCVGHYGQEIRKRTKEREGGGQTHINMAYNASGCVHKRVVKQCVSLIYHQVG